MSKKRILVVIYMRYSSNMQNNMSIKAQHRAILAYCKKHGYIVVKEYVDEAKTATNDKRPNFQLMISEAGKLGAKAVIVHKLDRFSRNKLDSLAYTSILAKKGIKLISVTEELGDDPESALLEGILIAINQYYSDNLGREVEKGKKEIAYKCFHTGGLPPYGYDVGADRKYIINDEESKAVRTIFDMYVHDYSYQQIADYLNKKGYRTKKEICSIKIHSAPFSKTVKDIQGFICIIKPKKNFPMALEIHINIKMKMKS